jgi:hypothetical protein
MLNHNLAQCTHQRATSPKLQNMAVGHIADHHIVFCSVSHMLYRSGPTYRTTLIIAPAHISVLNDVFAWFIVP